MPEVDAAQLEGEAMLSDRIADLVEYLVVQIVDDPDSVSLEVIDGRKGEVLAQPLRGLPSVLEPGMRVALTPPALKRDRFCTVVSVTDTGDGDLVSFEGIDDLTAAEGITGCYVLANRDDFELDTLDAAYADLMGREVVDERFGSLGTIVEIMSTPANDVWVVEGDRYGEVLIPVIEQVVLDLPDTGTISVHVMDGLIDMDK